MSGCLSRLTLLAVVLTVLVGGLRWAVAQEATPPAATVNEPPAASNPSQPAPAAASLATSATTTATSPTESKTEKIVIPTDPQTVIELLSYWLAPFVIASIVMVWFTLERLVVLRRGRVIPKTFVKQFLADIKAEKLDQQTALAACEKNGSPIAGLFVFALQKWARPSVEVEQAVLDGGERIVARLRTHVRVLNTISVIMPMVGLLGTVGGLIGAFNKMATENAMGNIEVLASQIAIALLTTAFGLGIAIPALTIYIYLCGRVESLVMQMDELGQQVAFMVSMEGQQLHAQGVATTPTNASTAKPRSKKLALEDATAGA